MRRMVILTIVFVVAVVVAVEFVPMYRKEWVRTYGLAVHVDGGGEAPRVVRCAVAARKVDADVLRASPPGSDHKNTPRSVTADPFDGRPLTVWITTTGASSAFGRELARAQDQYVVVIAEWADGQRVSRVVEVPDGRATREVQVVLPELTPGSRPAPTSPTRPRRRRGRSRPRRAQPPGRPA
jgi:hypothetical protein